MSTSTWRREGAVMQAMPANEWGTLFNVFDDGGERVAEVRLETARRGAAGTFWRDSLGATRVVEASGEARLSGGQEAINTALVFRLIHAQPIARRAANEAARWNREPLPYPAEGRWADEDENQAGATAMPLAPDPAPADSAAVEAPRPARRNGAPQPIRRAIAICREAGIDFHNGSARREAVGAFLGRRLASCRDLSLFEWGQVGTAIKTGDLAW